MKISDLTPQEKMLLFLMRLSDALPAPGTGPRKEMRQDFFEHQERECDNANQT